MTHPCLKDFHPAVARWFMETFGEPTPPQAAAWPQIAAGKNLLLLAPTGSGKTLAAFLKVIDRLYQEMERGETLPGDGVRVLYVSPLKALNNDIYRNLELPLQGIRRIAPQNVSQHSVFQDGIFEPDVAQNVQHEHGAGAQPRTLPEITRAVRSGDTPPAERQRMLRQPPQILITTPESLFLILSSKASRILRTVRCLIVDEIHTVFTEKRGAHLALSLERLQNLVEEAGGPGTTLQRIGLSATIRPLEEVAVFLGGYTRDPENGEWQPRPVEIIDAGGRKDLDLQITLPVPNLRELPEKTVWPSIYNKIVELVRSHRTTLVFVNNRRLAERVTANLNRVAGKEIARTHHGSLSREIRLEVEGKLKSGELPCVVATASLELGIDVGEIDLVIQIESPKEVARGLQRVGRAGHVIHRTSKGRIIPKNRADLLETAALIYEMKAGRVETMKAPMNCLDILAQHLVAMTTGGGIGVEKAYQIARSVYNFHTLSRTDLERVLAMLNGSFDTKGYLDLRPRLFWDRAEGVIKPDSYGKRLVYTAGGTIPDRGYFGVYLAGTNLRLGELDEEFVSERRLNDRFLLGTSVWRIEEIRQDRVIVAPSGKGEAHVPFWKAEQGGRPYELGKRIGAFLALLEAKLEAGELPAFLQNECNLAPEVARNLQNYLAAQKRAVDCLPTSHRLVVEEFPDEAGEWRVLIHSPLGHRVHLPLALLIGMAWEESLGTRLSFISGDDGVMFSLPGGMTPPVVAWPDPAAGEIEERLGKAVARTPLFSAIFRQTAQRSLVMPRGRLGGKRQPLWLARIKAGNLLQTVAKYPDFPLVLETYREIFQDYFDLDGLCEVLQGIKEGGITVYHKRRQTPSPFAHGHLFNFVASFMYETDLPRGEGYKRLFGLGAETLKTIVGKGGFRDLFRPDVIKTVARKARGFDLLAKNMDEEHLSYLLERCGDLTEKEISETFPEEREKLRELLAALCAKGKVVGVAAGLSGATGASGTAGTSGAAMVSGTSSAAGRRFFVNKEELADYLTALPGARICGEEKAGQEQANQGKAGRQEPEGAAFLPAAPRAYQEAKERIVARFARTHGPFTARELAARYGWRLSEVEEVLAVLASAGLVETGEFLPDGQGEEWCDTEILREIHRRSLARARQEIKARTRVREPEEYAVFLARWQGVTGERREAEGLAETLSQLTDLWFPAEFWEKHLLPARVKGSNPLLLDRLFASGQFFWRARGGPENFRVMIESSFTPEEEILPAVPSAGQGQSEAADDRGEERSDLSGLSGTSRAIVELLKKRGAETLPFILKKLKLPILTTWQALEELILRGLLTNDSFGPVRYLLRTTPQIRAGAQGVLQPAVMAQMGRWSLPPPESGRKEKLVWALLRRYAVLSREIAQAEGVPWGEVYPLLDTLENTGRVKRGYFIKGLSGIQYALPQALAELDAIPAPSGRYWALAWADPANPLRYIAGRPETAEAKIPAGDYLVFKDGKPILIASGRKLRLQTLESLPMPEMEKGMKTLITALYPAYPDEKIIVSSFNGEAAPTSPVREILKEIGFESGYREMVLWPSDRKQLV
ncbi:MAG TPA: DEAD/DEAH box helicase [Firmicutes bacterium]|nr:DEAD/DEAH box helicase [Bacillota bacterium]